MPGYPADEVARRPDHAPAWTALRDLAVRRCREGVQYGLVAVVEFLPQVGAGRRVQLARQPRKIAAAQHMLADPLDAAAPAARPGTQLLAGGCRCRRVKCLPARLQ